MCISFPAKVLSVCGSIITAELMGEVRTVFSDLPGIEEGSWVLIHANTAVRTVSPEEAEETINLLREAEQYKEREKRKDTEQEKSEKRFDAERS